MAASIAQLTASETVGGQVLDAGKALATYSHVFGMIGLWGLGAGVGDAGRSPWLKELAHGVNEMQPQPEVDGDRESAHPMA